MVADQQPRWLIKLLRFAQTTHDYSVGNTSAQLQQESTFWIVHDVEQHSVIM
tara:strand:- start:545 stop:700 length:156 start_codon:yes stop_codon:yes gene_type:complete